MRRSLVLLAALTLLGFVAFVYLRVGWDRMEAHCSSDAVLAGRGSASFSWQWQPLGFTCTYRDGESTTSLWY